MTDTITESFCERCGTRYSFEETVKQRRAGIGRVRLLTRGLRNYVANPGMPMDQAMAEARNDDARADVLLQLDAFHQTFNFCMSCRQYTCANCWNETAGECLACAPDLSLEVLPAHVAAVPLGGPAEDDGHSRVEAASGAGAWPAADLEPPGVIGAIATSPAEAEPGEETAALARLDTVAATPSGVEADELTAAELAEVEAALAAGHPAFEASAEPRFEPMAAPEPAEPSGVPLAAAEPAAEPAIEARPAAVDAATEPTAGPATGPEPTPEPAKAPAPAEAPAPAGAPAPVDAVEQPTWRVGAPDGAPAQPSGRPPAPAWPTPGQAPHTGPAPRSAAAPWAARLATARPEPAGVWAASSQEVLAASGPGPAGRPRLPAVQACASCGLSLSANARFCRRCGSRQA